MSASSRPRGGGGETGLPSDRVRPLEDRVPADPAARAAILAAHDRALAEGQPGYVDPLTGLFVFSALGLWQNGRCCGSGCRHCPYTRGPRC